MTVFGSYFGERKGQDSSGISSKEAFRIISEYGALLEHAAPAWGTVADASRLPHPKDKIKGALIVGLRATSDSRMKEHMRIGYLRLADWQEGVGETNIGLDLLQIDMRDPKIFFERARWQSEAYRKWEPIVKAEREQLETELSQLGLHLTSSERAETLARHAQPFTRAILLRGAHCMDEARREWIVPTREDTSFNGFAASCAITLAYQVTSEAMDHAGRNRVFLPYEPIPKDAPIVVAFALLILSAIHHELETDGIEVDYRALAAETVSLFFLYHCDEERTKQVLDGMNTFRSLVQEEHPRMKEWREEVMKLVRLYILQWTTDKEELRKLDCGALFGSLLASLLKAVGT